ncbi:nuclear transport factor 2 family protein [Mycobacterium sp. 852002-51163_SCH5372311]|uniref:nuclear transport factor 2 family protein n=1 Tax=Mycobacterium sp. 852002-51163_SCH5372311 TaxID=1834097 RepID=UPI0012E92A9C|nr:nuclear transport factor 2 family protein [Mycobacterium sp. 852002-51163_SCH5372311]
MFLQSLCEGGDLDEGFALLSEDFTYWSIVTRVCYDKVTLRRGIAKQQETLLAKIELVRCINAGETVVVEGLGEGTSTDGVYWESPFVYIFEIRAGLIVSMREYTDPRSIVKVFPELG